MNTGYALAIEDSDTVTISGSAFAAPLVKEAISLTNAQNITFANNLVAYSAAAKTTLKTTTSVTNLTGSANGLLSSGRAYALTNSSNALLLAASGDATAGTSVQQADACNAAGRWLFQPAGSGYRTVSSAASGLLLGVQSSTTSGTSLALETATGADSQLWTLSPVSGSSTELILVNKLSGLVASVSTATIGEAVRQTAATGATTQSWSFSISDYAYATWAASTGASTTVTADDDGDGLVNLQEYALGTDPLAFNSSPAAATALLTVNGTSANYLTLTFNRLVKATDIAFTVEYTSDLATWTTAAVRVNSSSTATSGLTTETWRAPTPVGTAARDFLRIRVTK
jgi:hypothetical protein